MNAARGSEVIKIWPEESQEAAKLVIDTYGEPHEATESMLVWHGVGPWKRIEASRAFARHSFPAPHIDSVTSVIDHRVPPEKVTELTQFDGSVVVARTAGEVAARCHDEQANLLALNLMNDIVNGDRTVDDARDYYAEEFLAVRRGDSAPYMEGLRFAPTGAGAGDPDARALSDDQLERASAQGGNG
ncbi:MAG: hypothetical protein GEV11_20880 [Streptosporangiales bacterium]|nr:hypothetical protein [Streptosporangiales bacterium]